MKKQELFDAQTRVKVFIKNSSLNNVMMLTGRSAAMSTCCVTHLYVQQKTEQTMKV
jgi:hypothetical protein